MTSRLVKRPPRRHGKTVLIFLTRGFIAVIDVADADLGDFNWAAWQDKGGKIYAYRMQDRRSIFLHRVIGNRRGISARLEIDHRDGDGLNCRRRNLRGATVAQNQHNSRRHRDNTSGVKGVSWNRANKRWDARIQVDRQRHHLGSFRALESAAAAYARAVKRLHRAFARPDRES